MMNHDDANNALSAYHDRELPPDQAEQVECHLGSCIDCRDELAVLQHLSSLVAPLADTADTEQFVRRVMARLPVSAPSFWEQLSGWWKVPALAASALLLLSVGSQITESTPSTSSLLCSGMSTAAVKHLCSDDDVQSDELMNLMWGDL